MRLLLVSGRVNQNFDVGVSLTFVVADSTCMLFDLVRSLMSNMTNIHLGYDHTLVNVSRCRNLVW